MSRKKTIRIPYFPAGMRWASPLLFVLAGFFYYWGFYIWFTLFLLGGILFPTTAYITEIDMREKVFRDYLSFLFLPLQLVKYRFRKIDKIIITKENHSQMINTRSRSRQLDWSEYTASLVMDGKKILPVYTNTKKSEILEGIREFTDYLKVGVEDQTTPHHYWIDMSKN